MSVDLKKPADGLDYGNLQDVRDCLRGYLGELDPPRIQNEKGAVIWDLGMYDFIPTVRSPEQFRPEEHPANVHKSLWRQALLNKIHGLFEVVPGVYQARGYDIANMTIVETAEGIVVIDCTTATEIAAACLKLYRSVRDRSESRPVRAVVITHPHTDHYAGVLGVVAPERAGDVPVIVPEHFVEEMALEKAFTGDATFRRATYQFGTFLSDENHRGPDFHVDCGLGKAMQRGGTISMIRPTHEVVPRRDCLGEGHIPENAPYVIDGVSFEFMLAPNTEAPAEMTVYVKDYKTLVNAEISNHTLHNTLAPRGTQARDARLWWKALDRLMERYGAEIEALCATHHWPTWGNADCRRFLAEQRDTYKFIHDQTVRLINKGYVMAEIAAEFEKPGFLPALLTDNWHNRGYYGTVSHNVRAIYQKYIGWYDMNPANLNPLPPAELATEYVKALGGEVEVIRLMEKAAADNNGRWAAELGKHLVFNNPSETNRNALAAVYKRLGYACESATWRNMYLVGARELEAGGPLSAPKTTSATPSLLEAMDDDLLFDFMASRFMAEKVVDGFEFEICQTDRGSVYRVCGDACSRVLDFHRRDRPAPSVARLELDRAALVRLILGQATVSGEARAGRALVVRGETRNDPERTAYMQTLFDLIENTPPRFNIAQP